MPHHVQASVHGAGVYRQDGRALYGDGLYKYHRDVDLIAGAVAAARVGRRNAHDGRRGRIVGRQREERLVQDGSGRKVSRGLRAGPEQSGGRLVSRIVVVPGVEGAAHPVLDEAIAVVHVDCIPVEPYVLAGWAEDRVGIAPRGRRVPRAGIALAYGAAHGKGAAALRDGVARRVDAARAAEQAAVVRYDQYGRILRQVGAAVDAAQKVVV